MLTPHTLKQKLSYLILGQRGGQKRVQIIEALRERPYNQNQLAERLELNYRTVKHHIDLLLRNELITTSRTGRYGEVYFVAPELEANLQLFRDVVGKLTDITTSSQFFQNVLEQTNDSVIIIERNHDVLFWNDSSEALFGHKREAVVCQKLPVFPEPGFLDGIMQMVEGGKKVSGLEARAVHASGNAIELQMTVDGVRDHKGALLGFSIISTDITERKQAQEALRLSEERYALAQRAAGVISWEWDPATDVMKWSDHLGPFLGLGSSAEGESFTAFLKLVHPEDRELVGKAAASILKKGRDISIEHRIARPDGSVRWVRHTGGVLRDGRGKAQRLLGIMQDITGRREAEQKYARMIETSLDGFWLTDMNGKFLEVNESYCRMMGYARRQLLGKSVADVEAVETPAETARHIKKLKETGHDRFETRHRRKDGSIADLEVGATYLDIEGGRLVAFLEDITERKRAEERIRHLASFPELDPSPVLEVEMSGKTLFSNAAAGRVLREAGLRDPKEFLPEDFDRVLAELERRPGSTVDRDVPVKDRVFRLNIFQPEGSDRLRIHGIDITERHRMEESLAESEKRFRGLFETMVLGVVYQDADGRITLANPAAQRILGLTLDQMQGRTSLHPEWRAIHPDGSPFPGGEHPSMVALRTGKVQRNVLMGVHHPNKKKYVWISINAVPEFRPGEDRPYQVYTTFEDITEQRRSADAPGKAPDNLPPSRA